MAIRTKESESPDVLNNLANLAVTHQIQEDYSKVEELGLQILERRKRLLGEKGLSNR
jgi:hypothetical protein